MSGPTYTEKHYSDKDIAKAQQWLRNEGSSIKVTGKFTIGMTTVLYKFQRDNGLELTGELDKATWKLLKKKNSWFRKLFKK